MENKSTYEIRIAKDKMTALLSFEAADESVTVEQILGELQKLGVRNGILKDKLGEIIQNKHLYTDYVIAEGLEPTKPFPGKVEYLFQTTNDMKPSVDKDGNVDYKNLSLISNVKQGQLLAKLEPAVQGEPGINILGVPLPPPQVKPVTIKAGKNTVFNENKTELFATKNGMVMLQDGAVMVNDVYQVPNHVGPSTGNINFAGNVIVSGNVLDDFTVTAEGDIEVFGVVEGAALKAGGNIVLHSGISGKGRAVLEADGNLMTKYIEQSTVKVRGNIHSSAILHSTVRCGGSVVVEGKKALISGGKIVSGSYVETGILGSHMGTVTEIEVGVNPVISEEYEELKKALPKVKNELEQIDKVIILLNKRRELEGNLDEDKQEMYATAIKNKIVLSTRCQKMEKDFQKLEEEMNIGTAGEIRVNGILYSGTRLTISNVNRTISDDVRSVKFIREGADLKMISI